MKTTFFTLLGLISLTFFSCTSSGSSDSDGANSDKDTTKTTTTTPEAKVETTPQKSPIYGIDISKYQGDEMDLMTKLKDSLDFVICRSTEGITYTDPTFKKNWSTAKAKGFIRGAYHFYMSNDNPQSQSANFANAIKDLQATDLPPIVDFEEMSIAKDSNKEKVLADLLTFLTLVEQKTGRIPMIYTDINIGNSYLSSAKFAKYPLWVADYNSGTQPRMPGAWKGSKWIMWQKSDTYRLDNIQDDFDCYNGSLAELKAFISGSVVTD